MELDIYITLDQHRQIEAGKLLLLGQVELGTSSDDQATSNLQTCTEVQNFNVGGVLTYVFFRVTLFTMQHLEDELQVRRTIDKLPHACRRCSCTWQPFQLYLTPQSMQKRVKQVVGSQCHHSCVQYHGVLMQTALLGMPTCIPSWTFKEVSRKL